MVVLEESLSFVLKFQCLPFNIILKPLYFELTSWLAYFFGKKWCEWFDGKMDVAFLMLV